MTSILTQDQKEASSGQREFEEILEAVYPTCRAVADSKTWSRIVKVFTEDPRPDAFPKLMALRRGEFGIPVFFPELARLELAVHRLTRTEVKIPQEVDRLTINPALQLLQLSWKNLPGLLTDRDDPGKRPQPGEEIVLIWRDKTKGDIKIRAATEEDLLVLKMVIEGIAYEEVAERGKVPVGAVEASIRRAVSRGLFLAPPSRIQRDPADFPSAKNPEEKFSSSSVFTLQWHITQACDLHCKHCYDRSMRVPLRVHKGLRILDDFQEFCKARNVRGQVSFTGGNPLLYARFSELYRAASDRGLIVAILGNPASRKQIEGLLEIQRPAFYQVSLEGLQEHNDEIRGPGHFERVMEFLRLLREMKIPSNVMLTLTKGNMEQVLPLGEKLRDLADDYTFNRLSMVGEGANLQLPSPEDFKSFIKEYVNASKNNPVMGWKDNLINIWLHQSGMDPFGGCTGYGCGAAFNFITLLSDGEVHACRKFPSLIGNIFKDSIADIYDSEIAHRYRRGPSACRSCSLHLVCRGCLAVAYSHGLDIFNTRDPYCFMPARQRY